VSTLSVVVMAFNEEGSLEPVVREIGSTLKGLECSYEIVIVDDGSMDDTGAIADLLADEVPHLRVVHHEMNRGLGGVYRTGFVQAKGDLITFFPADGQFSASIIPQFVPLMGGADMVLGYLTDRESSLLAKGLSTAERVLYRLLFGPLPRFQGILMFRRTLLDEVTLKSTGRGWAVVMELIVRVSRSGYRILSVPTEMRPRMSGRSKVNNLHTIWANLRQVAGLRRYL
jgi:glycosyltransferase involved in cell wall biosynthesis